MCSSATRGDAAGRTATLPRQGTARTPFFYRWKSHPLQIKAQPTSSFFSGRRAPLPDSHPSRLLFLQGVVWRLVRQVRSLDLTSERKGEEGSPSQMGIPSLPTREEGSPSQIAIPSQVAAQQEDAKDGKFWMSIVDFANVFCRICVCPTEVPPPSSIGGWALVAGGWWLVVGGWWLVAGCWLLVACGWLVVASC